MENLIWQSTVKKFQRISISIYCLTVNLYLIFLWQAGRVATKWRAPFSTSVNSFFASLLKVLAIDVDIISTLGIIFDVFFGTVYLGVAGLLVYLLYLPCKKRKQKKNYRLSLVPSNGFEDMEFISEKPYVDFSDDYSECFRVELRSNGRPLISITEHDEIREAVKLAANIQFVKHYIQEDDLIIIIGRADKVRWSRLILTR